MEYVRTYYKGLFDLSNEIGVTDLKRGKRTLDEGIQVFRQAAVDAHNNGRKLVFVGNGGSCAIASHMATDYLKNGGLRSITLSDSALLTCLSNDLGYENVYSKSIDMLGNEGDVLVAISSSGESNNIINAVSAAFSKNMYVITLSGFKSSNRLRGLGNINFYVPSSQYGFVEITHLTICHCVLDKHCGTSLDPKLGDT